MRLFIRSVLLGALVVCAMCPPLACQKTAPAAKPAVSAFDQATLEAYVRHLFLWGPEVKVVVGEPKPSTVSGLSEVTIQASAGAASVEQLFYISRDGKQIIQGKVYDIDDNPFRKELSKMNTASSPSLGTPGAPVVLVLFTDFQCPYCREEADMLRKNLLNTFPKEVRLYLKDFPLEQIHPWAKPAAIAGRCVFQQNPAAFWLYHDWVFEQQQQLTPQNLRAKVMTFAQGKEIDMLQLGRCIDTKATEAEVDSSIADAQALKVNATPTLFVNGRRLAAQVRWPQLETIIRNEIEYQKTANNAGDQACCEVTLTSPQAK